MSNRSKRRNNKRQKTLKNIGQHKRKIRQYKKGIKRLEVDKEIIEMLHDRLIQGDNLNAKEEAENLIVSVWAYSQIKDKELRKKFDNGDMTEIIEILSNDDKQRRFICDFATKDRIQLIFGSKVPSICREAQIDLWKATINPKDGDKPVLGTVERDDGLYMDFRFPDDWDSRHKSHCFASRCIGGVTHRTVEGKIIAENCRWYHDGPKTIEINNHQFDALKQFDLKISSDMFRAPYPVFRLKLPSNVMKRARNELGEFELFDFVICSYDDSIFKMYMPGVKDSIYYFEVLEKDRSLEDILMEDIDRITPTVFSTRKVDRPVVGKGIIDNFTRDLLRAVWNLSLLMTNGYTKHTVRKKQLKSDTPYPRECDVEEILSFEQSVCTIGRMKQSDGHDEMPVDGNAKRPHWRRGHWRQQRCGPGGRDRRPIFIDDIFVRSDLFSGETSDTSAKYKKAGTDL
jgi:hypothetical protein